VTGLVSQLPALSGRILLVELNHRINNDFASGINLVSVAVVRTTEAAQRTTSSPSA
jgi:hypothetical protein